MKGKDIMKKIRLLFQGDSITDWGRNRNDYHDLGNGYPKFAAQNISRKFVDYEFEFINLGISGNETKDLENRLQTDFIDIQPNIVSILVGINDVWHHAEDKDWIPSEIFEKHYRTVLEAIKAKTNAKIMIMEPYLIPVEDKLFFREDLGPKIEIIRKLSREFADVYLPTDGLIQSALIGDTPSSYAADGVHPTEKGAQYIAKLYFDYISKLIV